MCVIMYKPTGVAMPDRKDLQDCFNANPDGAGFMLPYRNKVIIRKGFMSYKDFETALTTFIKTHKINVLKTPIVCHFRISTQGGVSKQLCHPYPLCRDYDEMRLLETEADIAMAHNGIISLTSESEYSGGYFDYKEKCWVGGVKKPLKHNDTMKFIKDYADLIVGGDKNFGKNADKCALLERLIGYSKLVFITGDAQAVTIGEFYDRNGVKYSNLHAFPREDESLGDWKYWLDQEEL